MVDRAGLENRLQGNLYEGSNPSLSARCPRTYVKLPRVLFHFSDLPITWNSWISREFDAFFWRWLKRRVPLIE